MIDSSERKPPERKPPVSGSAERTLVVAMRNYFGRVVISPVNEPARLFAELLGQKTLTEGDVELIKRLGFEIKTEELIL